MDIFFVAQMLVCLEIAGTKLEELTCPLRTQDLVEKVQLHHARRLQASDTHQGFTADDAKRLFSGFRWPAHRSRPMAPHNPRLEKERACGGKGR